MSDIILNSSTIINNFIISNLKKQFKCINCKFINIIDFNSKLNCSRTARYQDNNKKIGCSMYIYKGR